MEHDLSLKETKKEWHGTAKDYVIGFTFSLLLTMLSFFLVVSDSLTGDPLIYILVTLALIQAIFQLLFFLHVGQEAKPRWETLVFYFMVAVLVIIAFGSLWIMHNLNERMMGEMPTMPEKHSEHIQSH